MSEDPFRYALTTEAELRQLYDAPQGPGADKQIDRLDEHCRRFIGASPLLFLASADRSGRADVTPRGGPLGS